MSEAEAKLGAGDVKITLSGTEYTLRPTYQAAQMISRQSGGIRGAIDAVHRCDMDAITRVIQAGLSKEDLKAIGDVGKVAWEAGLTDSTGQIALQCIDYLTLLLRGGRPEGSPNDSAGPRTVN